MSPPKVVESRSAVTSNSDEPCPLCSASTPKTIVVQLGPYRILRCPRCTNAWTDPPCNLPDYESQYFGKDNVPGSDHEVRRTMGELHRQWQKLIRKQLEICQKIIPPGGRTLDIGCGDGIFVEELGLRGFHSEGIEPSLDASTLAVQAGLRVVRGYFPHPEIKGPYDLVTLTHVFEHVPDPRLTLRQISAVAPGGYLMLTQSNYRGVIPRTFLKRWYAWVPDSHFWHFTPRGLRQFLQSAGYEVQSIHEISLVHTNRRHRYLVPILDLIPGLPDQFITVARIPAAGL